MPGKKQIVITRYDVMDDFFAGLDMCTQEDFLDDTEIGYEEDGEGHLDLYYPNGDYAMNTGDEGCDTVELFRCGCTEQEMKTISDKWLKD